MRITLLIYSLGLGGAERVMSGLADRLADDGNDVLLVTVHPNSMDAYELSPRVRRVSLDDAGPTKGKGEAVRANVHRAVSIAQILRAEKPDVVVSFIDRMNVLALVASLRCRVPIVVSERIDPRHHRVDAATRILRIVLYPFAAAVVVQTESVAKWARHRGLHNVHRIPNWVTPSFTPGPRRPRSRESGRVVAAGRLSKQKGYDLLLEAFAMATEDRPSWTLTIYGEGPEKDDLMRQAERLGIAGRVQLPGPSGNLERAFRESDLFVLSSRYEGFPNVLLEAMASGLAVASFACESGPQDVIRHELDGLLVPPNDIRALAAAIRRLVEDVDMRDQLGRSAVRVRDRFGVEEVSVLWDDLLQQASAPRRSVLSRLGRHHRSIPPIDANRDRPRRP
jgi:GalNAc-alpha-(1->4)-GalNAc-alpha-(1->3)-diNAcBac-PP-undecaprenol alpha-1,4-N-acetyl-D-galactosaminyltransferase